MSLQAHDILQRDLTIPSTKIDNDIVVMSIENGEYYAMDSVAAKIWAWLEHPIRLETIYSRLKSEYILENNSYQNEACDFLSATIDKQLCRIIDTENTSLTTQESDEFDSLLKKSTWQSAPKLRAYSIRRTTANGSYGSFGTS